MLVEINLLPQKEPKNKSLLLLAIISIILLLIGGFSAYWLSNFYEKKMSNLDARISTTEQIIAEEQQNIVPDQSSSSLVELENTIKWAEDYPIKTVPVLKNLTKLLPEGGYIRSLQYDETDKMTIGVQFESTRDAAYYLNTLLQSKWFTDVKIINMSAETNFYDKTIGEDRDESKMLNEKYVPRYIGEFEIILNRNEIKKEMTESSNQEGGEGS